MIESGKKRKGMVYAMLGASFWGLSGTCGQYLFETQSVKPEWIMVVRLLIGGGLLTLINLIRQPRQYLKVLTNKKDVIRLLVFALLGILTCQYTYLVAIDYTNSGTATVLQYLAPVLILMFVSFKEKRLPSRVESIAIICAMLGVFIIATHGKPGSLVLSKEGLIWGLLSAVTYMAYTLLPRDLLVKYGSSNIMAMAMLISGLVLFFLARFWTLEFELDLSGILAVATMTVLGTLLSFYLYFEGIILIGPVRASMVASAEPIAATLISYLWLGTYFGLMDLVGFAFIIATVFILAREKV